MQFFNRTEDRGSPDSNGAALEPTPTQGISANSTLKQMLGNFTVGGKAELTRLNYSNVSLIGGGTQINETRDRTETSVSQRGSYEFHPGYSGVMQVTENQRIYDQRDSLNVNRNSQGYRVESGLGLDISQLMKGDILVGYMSQEYENSSLPSATGIATSMTINWTPSELTLVLPALSRTVQETTTTGASGMIETTASVLVRHELLRNLVTTGYVGLTRDELVGLGEKSLIGETKFGATYSFIPEVYIRGELSEKMKTSQVENTGYEQTLMTVRVGLRL